MLVSKSKFAEMVGRTPARVSQWVTEGKLSGALVGAGRAAQIDVDVALAQLGLTLDLSQQLALAAPILAAAPMPSAALPLDPVAQNDQQRLLKAKADREELARAREQAEAEELSGNWLVTADAEAVWTAELTRLRATIESWLGSDAAAACRALAASGTADERAFAVALRKGFTDLCARLSAEAGAAPGDGA